MSDRTAIEWTHIPGYIPATWNPVAGCTRVSEGCRNCYAERMAARFSDPGMWGHGYAERTSAGGRWTGRVELQPDKLDIPLRARRPRCYFVNSTSDLFHERLPDDAIDRVFAVMALAPQHIFIVLTKRSERMRGYFSTNPRIKIARYRWPLRNVWLGVSIEDRSALPRLDNLRATPSAVRLVSFEPLLDGLGDLDLAGIDWAITGGESGPGARPMHPDWARSIRDQCIAASVPFFFKQNGEFLHEDDAYDLDIKEINSGPPPSGFYRVGKKRAGRTLDGRTWEQWP